MGDHIDELNGLHDEIIYEVKKTDLTLPIIVSKKPDADIYSIKNGTNTAFGYWEDGLTCIRAQLDPNPFSEREKLYKFEELDVVSS
ncbi:hypothetical protein HYZ41_02990 [archaeon]|nr:hypothetical protein [archaeon]